MDKRVEKTKSKIHDSLVELLKELPLGSVTVSQLCRKAAINRNTFYAHYENTADVLEEIITRYESMALETIQKTAPNYDFEKMMEEICLMMYNNKNLKTLLNLDDFASRYLARTTLTCNEQIIRIFNQKPSRKSPEELAFVNRYATGGATLILLDWCRSEMKENPISIAKKIAETSNYLLNCHRRP